MTEQVIPKEPLLEVTRAEEIFPHQARVLQKDRWLC